MPVYCFSCGVCGRIAEELHAVGAAPDAVECGCGGNAGRDIGAEHGAKRAAADPYAHGHASDAMGVHPAYREQEQARLRKLPGCSSVDVNRDGQVVVYSKGQWNAVRKDLGMVDKSFGRGWH